MLHLGQLLHDRIWRTGHDVAALENLRPGEVLQLLVAVGGELDLTFDTLADGGDAGVARRAGEAWVQVQTAVVEIQRVFGIQALRLGVAIGHGDELQKASPIRIWLETTLRDRFPETLHHLLAA